jgi:hypothetical protein
LGDSGCSVLQGVLRAFGIFVQISVLGLMFICLGSLGNSVFAVPLGLRSLKSCYSLAKITVSVLAILLGSVLPFFVHSDTMWWRTYGYDDIYGHGNKIVWFATSYQAVFLLGCVLLAMKFVDVLLSCFPERYLIQGNSFFSKVSAPAGLRTDRALKQASSFKVVRRTR